MPVCLGKGRSTGRIATRVDAVRHGFRTPVDAPGQPPPNGEQAASVYMANTDRTGGGYSTNREE